jgi:hypothetical protein
MGSFKSNIIREKNYTMSQETMRVQFGYGVVLWMPYLVKQQKLMKS